MTAESSKLLVVDTSELIVAHLPGFKIRWKVCALCVNTTSFLGYLDNIRIVPNAPGENTQATQEWYSASEIRNNVVYVQ